MTEGLLCSLYELGGFVLKRNQVALPGRRQGLAGASMHAFGDFLNEFAVERGDVIGLATGNQAMIDDDRFIDPLGAGVFEVALNGMIRGHSATRNNAGVDQ